MIDIISMRKVESAFEEGGGGMMPRECWVVPE